MRTLLGWAMVLVFLLTTLWQHHRSHQNWLEARRWEQAYADLWNHSGNHTLPPEAIYIPERNDYACPEGWTPAGGWGTNGVPMSPHQSKIGCKLEAK